MTFALQSVRELPAMCDQLAREKFFGEVRLIFRNGRLDRVTFEHSIQVQPQEKSPNAHAQTK